MGYYLPPAIGVKPDAETPAVVRLANAGKNCCHRLAKP
jgi:hypothetical protein